MLTTSSRKFFRAIVPPTIYATVRRIYWRSKLSPLDRYRRIRPVSPLYGRGLPVDRHYIETFLENARSDVSGRVLEVAERTYTMRFGGKRVTRADILHVAPSAEESGPVEATIIGNLETGEGIPCGEYDCIILTQVLQFIYDVPAAIRHAYQALAPGGVLLATVPGISQVSRYDIERWGEYWRFTDMAVRRLFADSFPADEVHVEAWGNVLAASAFLYGVAADELRPRELAFHDPDYPLVVTVRAVRDSS